MHRWFVGIDWASQEHVVTLCDSEGNRIGERKFDHGGTGLSDMISWLLKASGSEPGEIHIAIETPHGPIVEALLERGFNVYSINPKHWTASVTASRSQAPRMTVSIPMC